MKKDHVVYFRCKGEVIGVIAGDCTIQEAREAVAESCDVDGVILVVV